VSSLSGPPSTEEAKAAFLLRRGSLAAVCGSVAALVVPVALLLLSSDLVQGLSVDSPGVLSVESVLVVAGAVLLLVALFLYRRAFVHLKHVDRRLRPVSLLCLLGSVGAVALVVAGAVVAGGSSGVTGCLSGHPTHALGCLRSKDAAIGYLSVAGFWLLWLGAAAVATGLVVSGRHFHRPALTAGGAFYGVLAAVIIVPFVALLVPLPSVAGVLSVAPCVALVAPSLVYAGARQSLDRVGESGSKPY